MEGNELTIINDSTIEVFKRGKDIVLSHRSIAANAMKACSDVVQQYDAAFAIQDVDARKKALAEIDGVANRLLVKLGIRNKEMKEARSGLTQLFEEIRQLFTVEENKLDSGSALPQAVQIRRNKYAKWINEEAARAEREKQNRLNKDKERVDIRAKVTKRIGEALLLQLSERIAKMTIKFNAITLETWDAAAEMLPNTVTEYDRKNKDLVVDVSKLMLSASYLDNDELGFVVKSAIDEYDYDNFYIIYQNQVENKKHELINRLESKKAELEEAKRLKEEKDKEALEQLERDKRAREEEECRNNEAAAKRLADEESQKQEVKVAGEMAGTLFNSASVQIAPLPSSRESYEIKVKNFAGWKEVITLWSEVEGKDMEMDELEGMTLPRMRKFCEKIAKDWKKSSKDKVVQKAILIQSKNVEYVVATRAINKKEKEQVHE